MSAEASGKTVNIRDLAQIVRSKNAGPYRLTFDIVFNNRETYRKVKESKVITRELIARLYGIPVENVTDFIEFDTGMAFKATIVRPIAQGNVGDADIYGAQQHAPLLTIEIPWE